MKSLLPTRPFLTWKEILGGILVTVAYLILSQVCAGQQTAGPGHSILFKWDSGHYILVTEKGYGSNVPGLKASPEDSEVAFFPAYPILSRYIGYALFLNSEMSLVVTAILCCVFVWALFFSLLNRWQATGIQKTVAFAVLFFHPASFFLITAYSESLYLGSILGLICFIWDGQLNSRTVWLAGLCGFLATTTRLNGVSVVPLGVLLLLGLWWESKKVFPYSLPKQTVINLLGVSVLSLLGVLSFFLFCQIKFGAWNLYLISQNVGWGLIPDYLAPLKASTYSLNIPDFMDPNNASQFSVTAIALLLVGVMLLDFAFSCFHGETHWAPRWLLYVCAWINFYIPVCGLVTVNMRSMVRYGYIPFFLVVLALIHLCSRPVMKKTYVPQLVSILFLVFAILSAPYLLQYFSVFLYGGWVA